ncbi:MAG: hypothetical protein Q9218_001409 [Villophora microphyllina]
MYLVPLLKAVILLLCFVVSNALEAIPNRNVWFHPQCSDKLKIEVWGEVGRFVQVAKASLYADANTNSYRYFGHVFKDPGVQDFISSTSVSFMTAPDSHLSETLSAIQITATEDKNGANVLVYCDQDSRWEEAPDNVVPSNSQRPAGKKAWHDAENGFVYDTLGQGYPIPGCRPGGGKGTRAQTYCNSLNSDGRDRCTVTICDVPKQEQYWGLWELKGMKTMLNNKPVGWFNVDRFSVVSTWLLHEVSVVLQGCTDIANLTKLAHTTYNQYKVKTYRWADVANDNGKTYKWEGVYPMSTLKSRVNAENLAYFGLGAFIQSMGYDIGKDGKIYPPNQVPTDQLKVKKSVGSMVAWTFKRNSA